MEIALQNIQYNLTGYLRTIRHSRIKRHLRRVELSLHKATPSHLSVRQLQMRSKTLDALNTYWRAGDFPINDVAGRTTPVFKDSYNNYCAVGYLLAHAGYDHFVSEIQSKNNYIRVSEIEDNKYLQAITSLGITQEEAARIQPTYGFEDPVLQSGDGSTLSILKLASVVIFVILQLVAYLFIKEMNMKKTQKLLSFFSLFLFSSLVMTGIWSLFLLINK